MFSLNPQSVCLSVAFVHCGQTVGRIGSGLIKMKLGMHCVKWGPSSPSPKGAQPPIFRPYLLRPKGCIDQDVTWYGTRSRPRRLCVRWGPRTPPQKGGGAPKFSAHVYCGQTPGWMKLVLGMVVVLSPGEFLLDGVPSPLTQKGQSPLPNFEG